MYLQYGDHGYSLESYLSSLCPLNQASGVSELAGTSTEPGGVYITNTLVSLCNVVNGVGRQSVHGPQPVGHKSGLWYMHMYMCSMVMGRSSLNTDKVTALCATGAVTMQCNMSHGCVVWAKAITQFLVDIDTKIIRISPFQYCTHVIESEVKGTIFQD